MEEFQHNIISWVKADNRLRELNEEAKELRSRRKDLGVSICNFAVENDQEGSEIQISDGTLKFHKIRSQSGLTLKFINDCLEESIGHLVNVGDVMEFIKSKRSITYTNDIKRSYN